MTERCLDSGITAPYTIKWTFTSAANTNSAESRRSKLITHCPLPPHALPISEETESFQSRPPSLFVLCPPGPHGAVLEAP